MMAQLHFNKNEYRQAKAFLEANDAEIIDRQESDIMVFTRYDVNGQTWYEYKSKLESPEDDYYLKWLSPTPQEEA